MVNQLLNWVVVNRDIISINIFFVIILLFFRSCRFFNWSYEKFQEHEYGVPILLKIMIKNMTKAMKKFQTLETIWCYYCYVLKNSSKNLMS